MRDGGVRHRPESDDPAVGDRRFQGLVVALVLVGVGHREIGDGAVEDVAAAEVGGDRDPIP